MPADRLHFYQQRKQQILQVKFQAIATTTDWNYIAKRQASFREELSIIEQLINIRRQSVYLNKFTIRFIYPQGYRIDTNPL
jgi:hypothetical protein